jgi:xanthine dehydrogenase accessory factor
MRRVDFWSQVLGLLESGKRVFVCLVAESTKGSPGSPGAALALAQNHDPMGTIGGGGVERVVLERAAVALSETNFAPCLEKRVHRKGAMMRDGAEGGALKQEPSGLICGGSQTHVMGVLEPERDQETVQTLVEALRADQFEKALRLDASGLRVVSTELAEGEMRRLLIGDDWSYQERLFNPRRVVIFGGGHCGSALAEVMVRLDFSVQVVERRADLYTLKRLPEQLRCAVSEFTEGAEHVLFPQKTVVVVMTSDFPSDVSALRGLLPRPFPFIGLMGARPKLQKIRETLQAEGFDETDWTRIACPVGLVHGSDTPEEIAVSVAAQILLQRDTLNLW